jgi:small GTP-binding protein
MVDRKAHGVYIEISPHERNRDLERTRKVLERDGWVLSENRTLLRLPMEDIIKSKTDNLTPVAKVLSRAESLLQAHNLPYEIRVITSEDVSQRGSDPSKVKMKVVLVGDPFVGKTSLASRFVLDQFDNSYIQTIGAKVMKKEIPLPLSKKEKTQVDMSVWDIMGSRSIVSLSKGPYFIGAQGILAVCDLTNEKSLDSLQGWVYGAFHVTGKIPVHVLVNKSDLEERKAMTRSEITRFSKDLKAPFTLVSARSGSNVEKAFVDLATRILKTKASRGLVHAG